MFQDWGMISTDPNGVPIYTSGNTAQEAGMATAAAGSKLAIAHDTNLAKSLKGVAWTVSQGNNKYPKVTWTARLEITSTQTPQ
jgi:hypothetical protein